MKKIITLFAALFLFLGMAQAQNVYFSGNSNGIGKIWKNDTLVYSISDTANVILNDMKVANDSTIYSAGYNYSDFRGHVWMNDSVLFTTDDPTLERIVIDTNGWTAAGGNKVWQNDSLLYEYPMDTAIVSNIYALAVDTVTGDIYAGGTTVTPGVYATVWKNDTILWMAAGWSSIQDLCLVGEDLYAAGFVYGDESIDGAVWQNDSIIFQIEDSNITAITAFNGSLYWAGVSVSDNTAYIWQDGEVLYSHPDCIGFNTLFVNEYGVYYAGIANDTSTLWKDGEVLYQPEDCESISSICVLPTAPEPPVPMGTLTVMVNDTLMGTVIGGGTYPLGDTIIIEAFPNVGCEFLYWNDSITDNPRSVVVTQDSTFTAYFGLIDYSITTSVEPEDAGTVTEGGIYHYGDTLTLEAIPNAGFVFEMWIDSITDNPREIIVTQDSSFVALFTQIEYIITTSVTPENAGTVTEGGVYHYGDTLNLEAVANVGFVFEMWNDSITDNPREIIVMQDSSFVAQFSIQQCLIETQVIPEGTGFVTGGGTYPYGDTIQLEATPNLGYEFLTWDDGNTDNPRTVVVTESQTYIATFGIKQCVVTVEASPLEGGIVMGGGTYSYGDTILLVAQNYAGYVFKIWSDEVFENPRQVIVEDDITYTAIFSPLQYQIMTTCQPEEGGTVEGAGTYFYGETATLYARPADDYSFLCWNDGIVSNPRYIYVTQNGTYTALFRYNGIIEHYHIIKVMANNPDWGTVTGDGEYLEGTTIEISATPTDSTLFIGWDDGNTDNPRSIVVTSDMNFTAIFEPIPTYTITVRSYSTAMGTVFGSGTYQVNTVVNIGAIPNDGYHFVGWQDDDMNNPRTITVTEDAEYVAYFSRIPTPTFTVTVYYDENQGFILGAGTYAAGTTASLAAIPADGYMFVKWSDGTTDNPKEVLVDHDIELSAFFNFTSVDEDGFETVNLYPNPANDMVRIEGLEGKHEIQIYNAYGILVKTDYIDGDSEIDLSNLSAGYYFLRVDGHTMKLVKE